MGVYIYEYYQKKQEDGTWLPIQVEDEGDDYYSLPRTQPLFAALGDLLQRPVVAGPVAYPRIKPILSRPRGLPGGMHESKMWHGNRLYSWLMIDEMLEYLDTPQLVAYVCRVDREGYANWDGIREPRGSVNFCELLLQPNVYSAFDTSTNGIAEFDGDTTKSQKLIPLSDIPEEHQIINIRWIRDIRKDLAWFKTLLLELKETHGNLRMTYGFDH